MHTSKHVILKYGFTPCIKCFSFIITSYDTSWLENKINQNNMWKICKLLQLSLGDQIVTLKCLIPYYFCLPILQNFQLSFM